MTIRSMTVIFLALQFSTALVEAAKPVSIVWRGDGVSDDAMKFERYEVRCTGSTVRAVTRWVADDQWCVEGREEKYCASRKIKTMKKACKLPVSQLANPALNIASGEPGKKP